jgi:HAE1 family hydrophobic/amphiphilic exporter-1
VRGTVIDTLSNVILGVILTGLVLLFFLHDIKPTIIVALAMPFSIIATFLVMNALGISINMLSLMGLSCATGTLVSNSVVVIENIFRHKTLGDNRIDAAVKGSTEVVAAVFASTLPEGYSLEQAGMTRMMTDTIMDIALAFVMS